MKTLLIVFALLAAGCSSFNAAMPGTYLNYCIKDGNTVAECQTLEKQAFTSGGRTYMSKSLVRATKGEAKRYVLYEDVRHSNEIWLRAEMCREGVTRWC